MMRSFVAVAIGLVLFLAPGCCRPRPVPPVCPPDASVPDAGPCGAEAGQTCCPGFQNDAGSYPPFCGNGLNCDPPGYVGICTACGEPGEPCCRIGAQRMCNRTSCSNLTNACQPE